MACCRKQTSQIQVMRTAGPPKPPDADPQIVRMKKPSAQVIRPRPSNDREKHRA
jgi:hypothetical protein